VSRGGVDALKELACGLKELACGGGGGGEGRIKD